MSNIPLDRQHRFIKGQMIRHVDATPNDPANQITVEQLTLRIVEGIAYPTYTISAVTYGHPETIHDVLDTDDLLPVLEQAEHGYDDDIQFPNTRTDWKSV